MDVDSLQVLLLFALAHGNVNHIIEVIMVLLGEWAWHAVLGGRDRGIIIGVVCGCKSGCLARSL